MNGQSLRRIVLLAVCLVVPLALGSAWILADWYSAFPLGVQKSFVGRQSCIECHATQATLFTGSHHDRAMDVASDETVLGKFDGTIISHHGRESRVWKDGQRFIVTTDGPDGKTADFEVTHVFGVYPLQQYMVPLSQHGMVADGETGRLQVLRISWNAIDGQWFHLDPPDVKGHLDPDDPLHWTGIMQNWNTSCAACHSTNLQKNFDPLNTSYHTTWSEIDVSCESCHGPASLHVELAKGRSLFWDRNHGYGLARLKTPSNIPQIETCAPCHSRRTDLTEKFVAGERYDDHFACQLVEEPVYFADGQVRDEDYVYGSFIQSRMFAKNVRCTDCHDPHSLKLRYTGNQLCTSCHLQQHPAARYDTPAHHHHAAGTPGSMCVDCHMPQTVYMVVDARRDHSFRAPRPDLSVSNGTPNACTGCHLDEKGLPAETQQKISQYNDWFILRESGDQAVTSEMGRVDSVMAASFAEWYSAPTDPPRNENYGALAYAIHQLNSPALEIPTDGKPDLNRIASDLTFPPMFRASVVRALPDRNPQALFDSLKQTLADPDPKVVAAAAERMNEILNGHLYSPSTGQLSDLGRNVGIELAQLCQHTSRNVRITAARGLAIVPAADRNRMVADGVKQAVHLAITELRGSLSVLSERAPSHMMLAEMAQADMRMDDAANALRTAIQVEPNSVGPRTNLAVLLESQVQQLQRSLTGAGQSGTAASEVQKSVRRMESLMVDIQKYRTEEHGLLGREVDRSGGIPGTFGLHYRYAMSCYLQGDMEGLEKHLKIAARQAPEDPTILLGLSTMYLDTSRPDLALPPARKLIELFPNNPSYNELLRAILAALSSGNK